jgi:uncharacterized C2H2 Zn-finger protein
MAKIRTEDRERFYICGRCHFEQAYLPGEEPIVPCPDCGWVHKTRSPNDVPSEIKLDLTKY